MTTLNEILGELRRISEDMYRPVGFQVWVAIQKISEAIEILAKQQEEMRHDEY